MSRFNLRGQGPIFLVGCGHGATHWIAAIFYILLPFVSRDLGLSYIQAGVFVAVFHVSSFLANFGSGAAVDLSGRRVWYQIVSLIIGTVALFGFGLSANFIFLCLMVVLIGAANNLWHPAAISYLSANYPERRGYAISIHALGANVGDAIAPLVAGSLLVWVGWQGTAMLGSLPVLILIAVFLVYLLPRDANTAASKPKQQHGIGLSDYLAGLKSLIRHRTLLGLCLMSALRSGAQTGLLMFLPLYLIDDLQVSPIVMGSVIMAMQVSGLIASPIAGVMSDRHGRRPVVMAGLSVTTLMLCALTFIDDTVIYITAISVLGFALFAVRPVVHSWVMDIAPAKLSASAASLLFGGQALLNGVIPLLGGIIADAYGLVAVFYLIAATMLAANLIVFLLPTSESNAPLAVESGD